MFVHVEKGSQTASSSRIKFALLVTLIFLKYANQAHSKHNTLSRKLLRTIRVYKQTGEETG